MENWWGYDSAAVSTEPPESYKARGFLAGEPIPEGYLNWLMQRIPAVFDDPAEVIANVPAGAVVVVDATDTDQLPGAVVDSVDTGAASVISMDTDGQYVVYVDAFSGAHPKMVSRDDLGTVLRTFTRTTPGSYGVTRILFDGLYVCACDADGKVELWDAATGTSLWEYDHGAPIHDMAWDGAFVYIAGDPGTGTKEVRALHMTGGSAGTVAWSYHHDADVYGIATAQGRVFIWSEDPSGHTSGATFRSLNAANGRDADNEGGTAADTAGLAYDLVLPDAPGGTRLLATDGHRLVLGYFTALASQQIEVRNIVDGSVLREASLDQKVFSLALDQGFIFAGAYDSGSDGWLYALRKDDLSLAWRTSIDNDVPYVLASDGFAVFAGILEGGGGVTLARFVRGNAVPMLCKRADLTHRYLPYRRGLLPPEGT